MLAQLTTTLAAFAVATATLLAQDVPPAATPMLGAGMPAPAPSVEKWLKGTAVPAFEEGRIYVVEFWATWCGPCIASMPHISALQREYADQGVTIIGTNILEDRGAPYDASTLPKVEQFVANQGDRMDYTVAYDGASKAMDANYMQAAGRKGIPAAFIVDRSGTIAWIGHPAGMDYALSEIVAGTWDPVIGPEREKQVMGQLGDLRRKLASDPAGAQADFDAFAAAHPAIAKHQDDLRLDLLKANGRWDEAYAIIAEQVDAAIARKDVASLNGLAWAIVDPEADVGRRDLDLALRAAVAADGLSGHENPAILDTVARCHAWKGDLAKAIELQTKAIELASSDRMKESLQKTLDEYQSKG